MDENPYQSPKIAGEDAPPTPEPKKRGGGAKVAGLLLALLVLYVLSVGPAVRYLDARWEWVYDPLIWLAKRWEPLKAALWWYLEVVWGVGE